METIEAKIILNIKKFNLIVLPIILIGPFLLLFIFLSLKKYLNLNGALVAFLIISSIFFSVYYIQKKMTSKAIINFDSQKIHFEIFHKEILSNEFSFNYNQITSFKIIGMSKNTDYFLKIVKTDKTNYSFRFSKPEMSDFKNLANKFILEFNSSTEKNKIEINN